MKSWLLLMLAAYSAGLLAEPAISIETRYYPVSGANSTEIWQSIQRRGPLGKDGKRYHAYTKWNINWRYRWVETPERCHLTSTSVSVEVEYLLPQLTSSRFDQPDFRKKWNRYYDALFAHEQQHKDFAVAAGREIEDRLKQEDEQSSCKRLQARLEQAAQQVIDQYGAKEREFDRVTDHGVKQGVVLP